MNIVFLSIRCCLTSFFVWIITGQLGGVVCAVILIYLHGNSHYLLAVNYCSYLMDSDLVFFTPDAVFVTTLYIFDY